MTAEVQRKKDRLAHLEQELVDVDGKEPRIYLIDQVLSTYVYTDAQKAEALLEEQRKLLDVFEIPDVRLTYLTHLATFCNQHYQNDEVEEAIKQALNLVDEYGSVSQKIDLYIDYAGNLINQGADRLSEAENYLEDAVRLLENFPDNELKARADCRYGALYLSRQLYPKALQCFLQAFTVIGSIRHDLSLKGHYFYTLINAGLGNVYERTGAPEKAIEAYKRTIKRSEIFELKGRLAWHYLDLGKAYCYNNDIEKAEEYFYRVLANETDDSVKARAAALANLGNIYIDQEEYGRAEELIDRAAQIYQEAGSPEYANSASMAICRANIREGKGEVDAAIAELDIAVKLAKNAGSSQILGESYFDLARLYAVKGDFEMAYNAQLEGDDYYQKYREEQNSKQQRELEAKYESEAREKEAERLKLKALQLQLRALRAQMNPHFLYNSLNSIQSFITANKATTASKHLSQFALLMRQSLEYTNLEHISLEDEIDFLSNYLEINCHLRFEGKLKYTIDIDEELEEDITGVPTMIIQPYVENAIEHGLRGRKSGEVKIAFDFQDDSTIIATIRDNGIGRKRVAEIQSKDPRRAEHRSRGTEITLSRLKLLNRMEDEQEQSPVTITDLYDAAGCATGTLVVVRIPVVDLQLVRYK